MVPENLGCSPAIEIISELTILKVLNRAKVSDIISSHHAKKRALSRDVNIS
jgi:hypothetical protein